MIPSAFLFQPKSGRTSAPRVPQAVQMNRGSRSDSRIAIEAGATLRFSELFGCCPKTGEVMARTYTAINLPGLTNWGQTVGSFSPCHALRVVRGATTTWL